jgi:hypothetical protein
MSDLNTQDHRIVGVLSRLEAVIDAENAAIGQDPDFDVSRSNSIKSRCLYEMTMLFNGIRPAMISSPSTSSISRRCAKN